jgi:hypothetical protein
MRGLGQQYEHTSRASAWLSAFGPVEMSGSEYLATLYTALHWADLGCISKKAPARLLNLIFPARVLKGLLVCLRCAGGALF